MLTLHAQATDLLHELNKPDYKATVIAPTNQAFKALLRHLDVTEDELLHDEKLLTRVRSGRRHGALLSRQGVPGLGCLEGPAEAPECEGGGSVAWQRAAYQVEGCGVVGS